MIGRMIVALGVGAGLIGGQVAAGGPQALDGELDLSFSSDGLLLDGDSIEDDRARAVAVDSNGSIVVVGSVTNPAAPLLLARYLPDGRRDPAFGTDGFAASPMGFDEVSASDVVVDSSGRIVFAGSARLPLATGWTGVVARYLPNGRIDPAFGVGGVAKLAVAGSNTFLNSIALDSNGAIVAAGQIAGDTVVVRLDDDGAFDHAFADAGVLVRSNGEQDIAYGVAIDRRNRIVVGGGIYSRSSTPDDGFISRLLPNGDLDVAFAEGGVELTDFGPGLEFLAQLTIDPAGRISAAGYVATPTAEELSVLRLLSNGDRDRSFGTDGVVITSGGDAQFLGLSLALQPDGRLVVGGRDGSGRASSFALWRYLADGTLDPTFGVRGEVLIGVASDVDDLAIDDRGRILAVGYADGLSSTDLVLARISGQASRCAGRLVTTDLALGGGTGRGADVVLGTGAADTIDGRGGADVICGAGGADTLLGGRGADRIDGGRGRDVCRGGRGSDTLLRCEREAS